MIEITEQQEATRRLRDQAERIASLEGRVDYLARELGRALDALARQEGRARLVAADFERVDAAMSRQAEKLTDIKHTLHAMAIAAATR